MRFLMVTTFYPPYAFGGDASYVHRLSNELARRGHEVDVVHCADAYRVLDSNGPKGAVVNEPGVTVHTLRSKWGLLSPLVTQQTGRSTFKAEILRDLTARRRYDVIHYHNMSLIGFEALTVGEAVKLYTTHEHWLVCPTHVLWRYNRETCAHRTCFSCQLRAGRPPQWWRYSSYPDRCLDEVDLFISPSRFTLAKHRELGFTRPMTHLPYFLSASAAPPADRPPHPRPYALFVGRLEKIKGVQNLIRAFRDYHGCDLIIIGDGAYGEELRAMAADLPHVHFVGRLSYEDLRTWYRHAISLVVPSICFEVFGIVILEAYSVSTPALVTPFGALPEVIEDSGGGVVYGSDEELIDALEGLRTDRARRDELGARGRAAYLRHWSEAPHVERYMEIIGKAAGSPAGN